MSKLHSISVRRTSLTFNRYSRISTYIILYVQTVNSNFTLEERAAQLINRIIALHNINHKRSIVKVPRNNSSNKIIYLQKMAKAKGIKSRLKKEGEFIPPDGGWGWMIVLAAGLSNVSLT